MTQTISTAMPVAGADVAERYEELRRQVLSPNGRGGGEGLALFLRQGMNGWIIAWLRCRTPGAIKVPAPSCVTEELIPRELCAAVVPILTAMALSVGQEMRAC